MTIPEPEFTSDDGLVRKAHYGPPGTEQPWDTIVGLGWGPQFAAANVLKYLRRTKDVDNSRRKARWYWTELCRLSARGVQRDRVNATLAVVSVIHTLTMEEYDLLQPREDAGG